MAEISSQVRQLRTDYKKGALDESSVQQNPFDQFARWMAEAVESDVPEANAMTLATLGPDGFPAARIVLLRGFDARGFVFYTNYNSAKGQEMAAHDRVSLVFFWPELERQVRITGTVAKVSSEESDAYFNSRPRGSRIGAWSSPQSQEIPHRDHLTELVKTQQERFAEGEVPRPEFWGGYRVVPHRVEFWQGRASRLHDRVAYEIADDVWRIFRIAP